MNDDDLKPIGTDIHDLLPEVKPETLHAKPVDNVDTGLEADKLDASLNIWEKLRTLFDGAVTVIQEARDTLSDVATIIHWLPLVITVGLILFALWRFGII